jgi:CheY-like chemotaxis protein
VGPVFRILLVEDFEPFRQFVRSALQRRIDLTLVGEARDGLEAVRKAIDLKPDLVLIDIGLPKLNGMDAAQQIHAAVPNAKLVFVTLESSPAIVREAFRLGAHGYIHKLRAQFDLLPAIETVLAQRQFISSNLEFRNGANTLRRHEVQFYSDDTVFRTSVTSFIGSALKHGAGVIALATKPHEEVIVQRLKEEAVGIESAIRERTFFSMDASEALSSFFPDGRLDRAGALTAFSSVIESVLKAVRTDQPRVAILGECCGLLCSAGNPDAAIQFEEAGRILFEKYAVDILCTYPLSAFQRPHDGHTFRSVCSEHSAVFSA